MEKIPFFSSSKQDMTTKNICSLKTFPYPFSEPIPILCAICCESQHHRIAHVGRELRRSLLQPPAHSRLALGFIQLSLVNLLGWSVGSCSKVFVTSTYRRDRGRGGAKSQKGLGPYGGLVTGAKAWSLVLKLSQEKPTNCFPSTAFMKLPVSPEAT